jgi:hypothetical protein
MTIKDPNAIHAPIWLSIRLHGGNDHRAMAKVVLFVRRVVLELSRTGKEMQLDLVLDADGRLRVPGAGAHADGDPAHARAGDRGTERVPGGRAEGDGRQRLAAAGG